METPIVIFDLDGTLTDSAPLIMESINYALEKIGKPRETPADLPRWVGPPLAVSFRDFAFVPETGIADAIAAYRENYGKYMFDVPLFEGVIPMLDALKAAGVPMAIATSKVERLARPIVTEVGLGDYFSYVCGAKDDGAHHTKTDLIKEVLDYFASRGYSTAEAYMVGDRIYDIEGGNENSVNTIGVGWAGTDETEFSKATYIAPTPADLVKIVLKGA
ncbi:HAD hydrolase, family IA, variant 1 [Gleimia coleocanis DSM 15436]|uniref:HAD hydrolase, family IA, variant 1 n=1 Tax=Gleimia coleocanis DSM 15436 TaxID=525245 RepID=C0W0K4_9ACTO|nr:HAD hydrolase-like protein [Gleimia coleocanis]EEH64063.1 HAD hydrolase, family IA, variant 1 [Gleimia coleocanis DSM 15436]